MEFYKIKCKAIDVKTESGICPGIAKTKKGEEFTIDGRTPEGKGMCINTVPVIYPMALSMRLTDKMEWEEVQEREHFDFTCPHGAVIYRVSRKREDKFKG